MRLFIIGATGKTGTQLVDLALARGHDVTAFVRSPEKLARKHPALRVVRGDPLDADQLTAALPGHDGVLSALGVPVGKAFSRHTLVEDGAASATAAMQRAGVGRLVLVSAAALFPLRGLRFAFFRFILTQIRRDLGAAEGIVRASSLDWTIARPPRLVQASDESYRSVVDALPTNGNVMSFRAVAAFVLDAVEKRSHVHEIVGLAR